jgi:uncharacterized protein
MKKRFLYYELIKHIEHKNALVITGMRQVGKSTLMKQIFDETSSPKLWFDFDNPMDLILFENKDYNAIYRSLSNLTGAISERLFVFIDELQNYPEATKVIKYLIDHYKVKFIVSGSSNYYLRNLFPESLSGRKFLFQLNPLSFQEFLYFRDKVDLEKALPKPIEKRLLTLGLFEYKQYEQEYYDFMHFGSMPEVVLTQPVETRLLILKNIFRSFFEKDIRILSDFKDITEVRDLIRLLVSRVGSMLDISRLASEMGIERRKIYAYLEFLQGVYFIRLLPRYSKSIDRSIAGGKKIYFSDTGILKTIGSINDGQLFENAVINQLAGYGELSFYNHRQTSEIDAILNNNHAFEIKLTGTPSDSKQLSVLCAKLGIEKHSLISLNFREELNVVYPMFL